MKCLVHPSERFFRSIKVKNKANIRNRYNQVSHLTQDTLCESDKHATKRHTQESQEVSPFLAGDHKAAKHRQDSVAKTNTNKEDPQYKYRLGTVSKLLEG